MVGKDDSAKGFSLLTTAFPSVSFWSVSSQKHLSSENYRFQHLCERNLQNDWVRMWGIAGRGCITAGERRGVGSSMELLSASSVQAEFSVFC